MISFGRFSLLPLLILIRFINDMKQLILFGGRWIRCSTKILLWFDMSGKRLYNYYPLIRLLIRKKLTLLEFQSIIRSFSDDTIKFICECCRNAISTCFVESLNCKQKSKLVKSITPYEKEIKAVCRKKKHFRKSKKKFFIRVWFHFSDS